MSGNGVTAAGHAIGIDASRAFLTRDFSTIALPGVSKRVLGVEMAAGGSGRDRFTHHHFTGLHGATGGWRLRVRIPEVPHNTSPHPCTFKIKAS